MFIQNILFSLREIYNQKFIFGLNIIGLSIGLTVTILITLHIINETGYDQQYRKREQIFRLIWDYHPEGAESNYRISFIDEKIKLKLKDEYPEIEQLASYYKPANKTIISNNNMESEEGNIVFTEPEMTRIFTFPVVKGDSKNLLRDNFDVLLTESKSKLYFKNENPIGKLLTLKTSKDTLLLKVKGIIKDFPNNSTIHPDFIIQINEHYKNSNQVYSEETYILLKSNTNVYAFEKKMPEIKYDYGTIMISKYSLQPLTQIYFHSGHLEYNPKKEGDIKNIYILLAIAIVILLVSLNNYTIYSIFNTRSLIKDIATRKTLGATLKNIRNQQFISTFIYILIALFLALVIASFIIPVWNNYFNVNLFPILYSNFKFTLGIIGILLLSTLISGSYIFYFITRLNPTELFHSSFASVRNRRFVQKAIIIFQIVLFVGLTSFAFALKKQLNFALNKNTGYDKENVLLINFSEENINNYYAPFIDKIKKYSFVHNVTAASNKIPSPNMGKIHIPQYNTPDKNIILNLILIDKNFFNTLEIDLKNNKIIAPGRNILIVNRYAATQLGIDKNTPLPLTLTDTKGRAYIIDNICNNFDVQGIRKKANPLALMVTESTQNYIYIKLQKNNMPRTLELIKSKYLEITKDNHFEAQFLDENIKTFYHNEYQLQKAIHIGAILTILIAFIGLTNMSLLSLKSRNKEILLRKVAGANIFSIIKLLLKNNVLILIIANIIAIPFSYWAISMWLQNYAEHIRIKPDIFIIPLFVSIVILGLTSTISTIIIYHKNLMAEINKE